METNFSKNSKTLGTLSIDVFAADYQPAVNKKVKEYAKTAHIKGFRPGHVPEGMIRSRYGKSIKVEEIIDMVNKQISEYIKENKIQTVGDPRPDKETAENIDWDNQNDFKFVYEIGMASDFEVNISNLPAIKQYGIEPSEERINESIEGLRKRFGKQENPESSENGDILFGTLSQTSSEFSMETGIPTDRLAADALSKFVGLSKESKVGFDIQTLFSTTKDLSLAVGKSEEEAAALAGEFEFEVKDITRQAPADLDQEFFDKAVGLNKATNEAELRTELSGIIKNNYERESDYLLRFDIEKALLNAVNIELPDQFLKDWLLTVNEGKYNEEQIEAEYDAFAKGLRMDLIRNRIGQDNEIKVEYADVLEVAKEEIRGYFGMYGGADNGMEDTITRIAENMLKDKQNKNASKHIDRAFGDKVINFVKEKVQIERSEVQLDEFQKIASETIA